jgi:peroxiredoxin
MIGRSFMGVVRSSFLIDEVGKIVGAWYKNKTENTILEAQEGPGTSQGSLLGGGIGYKT